jgi:small subunit ribosomal protein S17
LPTVNVLQVSKLMSLNVRYRDEIEDANKLFGESENRFQYDKAPKRGWLEDKKDFTHRETYIKYHVFEDDDQPYAV